MSKKMKKIYYGAVRWVSGKPILDGMPIFETKKDCLNYIKRKEIIFCNIKNEWTIIFLEQK